MSQYPNRFLRRLRSRQALVLAVLCLAIGMRAYASVALLMEEPFGEFGAFNPTGHASVYLNHICAASPTELRACQPGEYGVVISRYHKIDGYDWIAIPIIPYLYAVDDVSEIPLSVNKQQEFALRDAYRRAHLEALAPDRRHAKSAGRRVDPAGRGRPMTGRSMASRWTRPLSRTSASSPSSTIAATMRHFNLFFHNCADFSRAVLDIYLPHAIHRNFIADVGLTTPKQVARSLVKYGKDHPEVEMSAFVIPQVPGSVPRSHPVDGVAESLVKSKKYLLPLAVLQSGVDRRGGGGLSGRGPDEAAEGRHGLQCG